LAQRLGEDLVLQQAGTTQAATTVDARLLDDLSSPVPVDTEAPGMNQTPTSGHPGRGLLESAATTAPPPASQAAPPAAGQGAAPDPEALFFPPQSPRARARALAASVVHARELARWSAAGVRAHGGSRLAAIRRLRLLRRRGFLYEEAVRRGMLDPAIGRSELLGYGSRHVALITQRAVNPATFEDLTTQKAIFYRYCAALGLPTPRLLAIIDDTTAGWGAGDRVLADADDFAALVAENPVDIVVKPSDGGKGVAVRVFRNEGGRLVDAAGAYSPQGLWHELRAHPDHRCFVVQERVRNHDDLLQIAPPAEALHTLRVVTFVSRSGALEVSQVSIRLGLGGHATDNFGDGSSGNGYCEIDPATGRLGPLRRARPDGCGFIDTPDIPSTGVRVEGRELPQWEAVRELAYAATRHFLPLRSIGWDIAITDRGPLIVEANREWTPIPQPGLMRTFARIATG
jgi:hypothetical protein